MTDFKIISLSDITPDENQPRKFFDETALAELAQSIGEKGVLQPVLVRPGGMAFTTPYLLVCGERRYRASAAAGLESIPAVIRELSDEEALELQIIENLQRKDVHPMEEAVAFHSLITTKNWTVAEVALRVGKKDYYIRQRLKLGELGQDWQTVFYRNRITLSEALEIALLPEKTQQEFYKDLEVSDGDTRINVDSWRLNQYKGDLTKATFSLADPTLDRKMGPCTRCQYNTSVAQLFADQASPRCMYVSCFKHKSDIHLDHELQKAKEDPAIVLITTGYESSKVVEALKKEGYPVLKEYTDWSTLHTPDKPDWEEMKEEADEDDTEENLRQAFDGLVKGYEGAIAILEKGVATGKYKKAFEVSGYHPGRYTYIELKKTGSQKSSKSDIEAGTASAQDIDNEITRIQDREKRNKELDGEKVHKLIVEDLQKHPSLKSVDLPLTQIDRTLIRFLLYEHLSYHTQDIRNKLGVPELLYNSTPDEARAWFDQLAALTDERVAYLVRNIAVSKYHTNLPGAAGGTALRLLAESLGDVAIENYESDQNERMVRRTAKVDSRLAELRKQKSELKKEAKLKKATSKTK